MDVVSSAYFTVVFFLNLFHELLRSHYSIDPKFIDDFTLTCSLKHYIHSNLLHSLAASMVTDFAQKSYVSLIFLSKQM